MRFIVTGGAGFIGSNLCRLLLREGHRVVCIDNFQTGRRENVEELVNTGRFTLVEHDVREPFSIDSPIDGIYNLACPASPPHYQADPIGTIMTSVMGTKNCLDIAHSHNVSMVQASTSEIYGDPAISPQPEGYWGNVNPCGPRSCYNEGKRCAEALCYSYRTTYDTDVKIARLFNVYGPYMDPHDGRVVSNFIVQALSEVPLTIYGSGEQTCSFCYIDDLVRGLYALIQTPSSFQGPVNLGNPTEITVMDLARAVLAKIGGPSRVEHRPLPTDDPHRRKPDITLALDNLPWRPEVSLDEGLDHTIAYFRRVR